jgi:uncharacterized protein (DUF433 family)/predicted nuclease of predicted toxin-antitoxin system
MAARGKRR